MFHKKNIDYVYLLWEDLLFQIEKKDVKKTNKMSYFRFTKIIIDYFMSKDQSISRRNKLFWHTARDDTMYTSIRCISRYEKTQVYGTILPKELTDQAMLEFKAYQTYYAFASGEKTPKPKYVRKKADSDTSPKQKTVQATKGTRIKTKAKVAKSDKKTQPLVTKRSKKDFYISHASGLGDGVDTLSKVPDEQQQKTFGVDEGIDTIPGVLDVPIYDSKSDKESWGDSGKEDDDVDDFEDDADNDDDSSEDHDDENYELTDDEETMYDDEDDEVTKELYEDVNVNLGNKDADMTNADQGEADQQNASQQSGFEQEEEDVHVTLTPVLETQKTEGPTQSSSVSSDFTIKLLNLDNPSPNDTTIASLMDTIVHYEITSATTIPQPPLFYNPLSQQATSTPTPTALNTTTLITALLDFTSVFKFNERVTNLEKDLSEIKQVYQYAQALSSIPAIVDRYMDNKLGKAIHKAIQAHKFDCREEAQAKKKEYIELVDSTLKTIIKMEVNTPLPKILSQAISDVATPIIEKNVTESMSRDESDKDGDPSARSDRGTKRRKPSKDAESSRLSNSKEKKEEAQAKKKEYIELVDSTLKTIIKKEVNTPLPKILSQAISDVATPIIEKNVTESLEAALLTSKSAHAEEPSHTVEDSSMKQDQEFVTRDNETMTNNPLTRRLPKLIGSRNPSDLQLLILIGVRDDKLTFDLLRPRLVKLHVLKNLLLHLMDSMILLLISLHLS
nr:hypothetical protein [Tanacetum cinerariifolium]